MIYESHVDIESTKPNSATQRALRKLHKLILKPYHTIDQQLSFPQVKKSPKMQNLDPRNAGINQANALCLKAQEEKNLETKCSLFEKALIAYQHHMLSRFCENQHWDLALLFSLKQTKDNIKTVKEKLEAIYHLKEFIRIHCEPDEIRYKRVKHHTALFFTLVDAFTNTTESIICASFWHVTERLFGITGSGGYTLKQLKERCRSNNATALDHLCLAFHLRQLHYDLESLKHFFLAAQKDAWYKPLVQYVLEQDSHLNPDYLDALVNARLNTIEHALWGDEKTEQLYLKALKKEATEKLQALKNSDTTTSLLHNK